MRRVSHCCRTSRRSIKRWTDHEVPLGQTEQGQLWWGSAYLLQIFDFATSPPPQQCILLRTSNLVFLFNSYLYYIFLKKSCSAGYRTIGISCAKCLEHSEQLQPMALYAVCFKWVFISLSLPSQKYSPSKQSSKEYIPCSRHAYISPATARSSCGQPRANRKQHRPCWLAPRRGVPTGMWWKIHWWVALFLSPPLLFPLPHDFS